MGKLKLNLDEIKVESFETNSTILHIGTVNGQQLPGCTDEPLNPGSCNGGGGGGGIATVYDPTCLDWSCPPYFYTCGGYSCNPTDCTTPECRNTFTDTGLFNC